MVKCKQIRENKPWTKNNIYWLWDGVDFRQRVAQPTASKAIAIATTTKSVESQDKEVLMGVIRRCTERLCMVCTCTMYRVILSICLHRREVGMKCRTINHFKNYLSYEKIFQWHGFQPQNHTVRTTTSIHKLIFINYRLLIYYF